METTIPFKQQECDEDDGITHLVFSIVVVLVNVPYSTCNGPQNQSRCHIPIIIYTSWCAVVGELMLLPAFNAVGSAFSTMLFLILMAQGTVTRLSGSMLAEVRASGENVSLTCTVQVPENITHSFSPISWYRREPDRSIHYVAHFGSVPIPYVRYSSRVNPKDGIFNFTISNLQRVDTGIYFCIRRSAFNLFPGSNSRLIVTDPAVKPSAQIMTPSWDVEATVEQDLIPLICLVTDALSVKVRLVWTASGQEVFNISLDGQKWIMGVNGSYTYVSQLSVTTNTLMKVIKCALLDTNGDVIAEATLKNKQNTDCLHQMILYGLPAVFFVSMMAVILTCIYKKWKKRVCETTKSVCREQKGTQLRRTLEDVP
ncbi:uncharacterized protein LOC127526644 [Erpetoichthys calabaricus]|uniref:uncharacterized protein LOC127526644 n=1 Tax=Erpetoichthys calabaricus TaxID=27687 RepID=UPI002233EA8F|nr:uncharacterized protein LOC127526644 [Erpetoichthys calabaricus]